MSTETKTETSAIPTLLRLRTSEQKKELNPHRRLFINALEIAIVLAGESEKYKAAQPLPANHY